VCREDLVGEKIPKKSKQPHPSVSYFYLAKPFMSGSTEGRKANAGESNEAWLKALAIFIWRSRK